MRTSTRQAFCFAKCALIDLLAYTIAYAESFYLPGEVKDIAHTYSLVTVPRSGSGPLHLQTLAAPLGWSTDAESAALLQDSEEVSDEQQPAASL